MLTFLLSPLGKAVGIGAIIIAAFFGFRLWLSSHDAGVRAGYVLLAEKTAADAKAAEMERQRNAASQALDELEKRRAADEINDQAAQAATDLQVAEYEKKLDAAGRQCKLDSADVDFILQH